MGHREAQVVSTRCNRIQAAPRAHSRRVGNAFASAQVVIAGAPSMVHQRGADQYQARLLFFSGTSFLSVRQSATNSSRQMRRNMARRAYRGRVMPVLICQMPSRPRRVFDQCLYGESGKVVTKAHHALTTTHRADKMVELCLLSRQVPTPSPVK